MPDSPERCTCGSVLVENAAFCHRCGRPTHEPTAAEQEEFAPAPPPPAPTVVIPPPPLPIGFGNPIALRVAFLVSLGIVMTLIVAMGFPAGGFMFLAWWVMSGWTAVRFYARLTGVRLSTAAGARLGFLTGLFAFLSIATVYCLNIATTDGRAQLDQMVKQMKQDPRMTQILNDATALNTALFVALVFLLIVIFVLVTGVCAASGALGARFTTPTAEPRR